MTATAAPVVVGKSGQRNLHTDEVMGTDPLIPYAPAAGYGQASIEKRVWQLRRVMDFPHAGDLMVISTVYADGTVAALEELIGNHGGVGGEQTDAFILHPPDLVVPDTRNSIDVFHILNNHRGAPVVERKPVASQTNHGDDWAPSTLVKGIGQVRTWVERALRCLILERSAYQEVVGDPSMTGPALLIALLSLLLTSLVRQRSFELGSFLASVIAWFVAVGMVAAAGYLLTKKGAFTKTFRALGFAQVVFVLELIALYQPVASAVHALVLVLGFLAVWIGAATAHQTRGWRTIVLPIVAVIVTVVVFALVGVLLAGVSFTFQSLFAELGIQLQ